MTWPFPRGICTPPIAGACMLSNSWRRCLRDLRPREGRPPGRPNAPWVPLRPRPPPGRPPPPPPGRGPPPGPPPGRHAGRRHRAPPPGPPRAPPGRGPAPGPPPAGAAAGAATAGTRARRHAARARPRATGPRAAGPLHVSRAGTAGRGASGPRATRPACRGPAGPRRAGRARAARGEAHAGRGRAVRVVTGPGAGARRWPCAGPRRARARGGRRRAGRSGPRARAGPGRVPLGGRGCRRRVRERRRDRRRGGGGSARLPGGYLAPLARRRRAAGPAGDGAGGTGRAGAAAPPAAATWSASAFRLPFCSSAPAGTAACGRAAAFLAGACFGASAENASLSLRTTGASIVEDADRTNSPISWSLAITALLSTPNSFASSYTRTFATALPYLVRLIPDPCRRRPGAHAPAGVRLCCSSPRSHQALITIGSCFPGNAVPVAALAGRAGQLGQPAPGSPHRCARYSPSAPVTTDPGRRSARANARRRPACSKHFWLRCR